MRKLTLAILSLLALQCFPYGNIRVIKDEFKNQTAYTLDLYSNTNFTLQGSRALFLTFTKTINEGSKTVIRCYLSSEFSNHEQPLGRSAYFKLNNKIILIKFQSTKIIPNEIRNATWSSHSGEFILSDELQKDLLNADSLSVRFYTGESPIDADLSSSDLRVIKELINIKP
ncbi:hypothetical protein [Leptospira licerasiae]|uniref:hypothetical protein n=1 Tax=Leptospira licerasiae TaxID=447106 RepID=UPI001083B692|nr:hypothetical protein [Leptospira licerasiae]TGM88711.1 hypothetical protein EHR05_12475 [Leptospira licerasiae]